jgi:hypothetical protein
MKDFCVQAEVDGRRMQVECELPNSSLYTFTGNLVLDGRILPLTPNHVLLRGCMLRNTGCILGVAIFTGHETKVPRKSHFIPPIVIKVARESQQKSRSLETTSCPARISFRSFTSRQSGFLFELREGIFGTPLNRQTRMGAVFVAGSKVSGRSTDVPLPTTTKIEP